MFETTESGVDGGEEKAVVNESSWANGAEAFDVGEECPLFPAFE